MTFEELQALMPAGIAVEAVRSWHRDKHWNVRFWTSDNQKIGEAVDQFSLVLRGKPGESVGDIVNRGMPVVRAALVALGLDLYETM